MSNPIEEGAKTMPRTVTVARQLSILTAALIALAGFGLIQALRSVTVVAVDQKQYNQSDVDRAWQLLVVAGVVFFVVLVAIHILAVFLLGAGRNSGRVVAWIVNGATVLCCGCGLGSGLISNSAESGPTNQADTTLRFSTEHVPGVYDVLVAAGGALAILSAMAVIVLLILPASSDFFRKPATVWTPPWAGDPNADPSGQAGLNAPQPPAGWGPPPIQPPPIQPPSTLPPRHEPPSSNDPPAPPRDDR
jgi:hypothetical protein